MGRDDGVTERQLSELDAYETSTAFDEDERTILRFVDAMTATPVAMTEPIFAAVRTRLGDEATVELTGIVAWQNYRARFDHAMGVEAEGFSDGAVCALPR